MLLCQKDYKHKKNGFPMQKIIMPNGLTVIYEKRDSPAVVVEIMIKTGSNHESEQERGISHFLEHLLFEGTKKRPSNWAISREIEKVGGEFNAYTTNERTCFYVRVLKKHIDMAIEILADIMQNSLLRREDIEREKKVVLKEIDLVLDEPRFYQWILLQKSLFKKHPCRYPTYGDKKHIKNLNEEKIRRFLEKYYFPGNMVLSIVGNVPQWKKKIESSLCLPFKKSKVSLIQQEPYAKNISTTTEKKAGANTYLLLGFIGVSRDHLEAYPLEIVNTILGRGQSGRLFTEIRSKQGLAYDVGTQHIAEVSFGYFALYATVDKKKSALVKRLLLQELEKIKNTTSLELEEAKEALEGEFLLALEDPQRLADQLLFWEQALGAEEVHHFVRKIKKVTLNEVIRVTEKYLKNYTEVVLEGN